MGVHSLAHGFAAAALLHKGQRHIVGIMVSAAALIGPVDVWAFWSVVGCMIREAWAHVFGEGLFAIAGSWLATE